ncbi:MAG: hypothetical protein ACON34_04045 [Flavobacteriales bacterium]
MAKKKQNPTLSGILFLLLGILFIARGVMGEFNGMAALMAVMGLVNIGVGIYTLVKAGNKKQEEEEL